jgi:type I restriction enzyme M protein
VPEGIIFQSGTAYKQLRKNLVNDGLYAVVSLPSGVFNPYAGVKTSILLFDNEISKKANNVLFVKIGNDGFDLGAQRRPLNTSHLPAALEILHLYKSYVIDGKKIEFQSDDEFALLVSKEKISKDEEYNLSGDRYRISTDNSHTKYPSVKLGEVAEFIRGVAFSKKDQVYEESDQTIKVATTKAAQENGIVNEDLYFIPRKIVKKENQILIEDDILISIANSLNLLGRTTYINKEHEGITFGAFMGLIRVNKDKILPKYLYSMLRTPFSKEYFEGNANTTTNISNLSSTALLDYPIVLPPLNVQKEIVEQIEVKQKAIEGAREVIKNLERERDDILPILLGS